MLIRSLYSSFQTSIITDSFQTPFIIVGRGVLQEDCLSPLTFNLCFNTFIRYISDQKFKQFGFSTSSLLPIHWFQFADDAAVITGLENENQFLLNHFTRWCTWANIIVRVDKCSTFGIRKSSSASMQYLPKLFINQVTVPTVNIGKSFKYLGRFFNFSMDNFDHLSEVLQLVTDLMRKLDDVPCHPKNIFNFIVKYVNNTLATKNQRNLRGMSRRIYFTTRLQPFPLRREQKSRLPPPRMKC